MALTPMMEQYLKIKEENKDAILFYRLGDFYEMFFEDAITCSRELELTLTGKDCGQESRAPMCGIPYHSVNNYIPRLISKGYKIAICEQVEDPKLTKGIVKREVVKIITPGTITETEMLQEKVNNYLCSVYFEDNNYGFSYADISTGEFYYTIISGQEALIDVINEIGKLNPSEIVINSNLKSDPYFLNKINSRFNIYISVFDNIDTSKKVETQLEKVVETVEKCSINLLYNYICETQKSSVENITKFERYEYSKFMKLDIFTRKNLEILESNRDKSKKGSLLWVLDETTTAMGGRLIRKWVEAPLLDKFLINQRLDAVSVIKNQYILKEEVIEALKGIYDIERIVSKIVSGNVNPRELISLKNSFLKLPKLKTILFELSKNNESTYLTQLYQNLDLMEDVCGYIESSIIEEAPITVKEGGVIRQGFDTKIDEYRVATTEGKNWLIDLELKEKELTGIKNLKVGFNKIFGYFVEVTNSYKNLVPEDRYIRKQTLAGCERYITEDLKIIEEKLLGASDKLAQREYEIFCNIRENVATKTKRMQDTAKVVAIIDVLTSFATVANNNSYTKPNIVDDGVIDIKDSRHAVVEKALKNEPFIENDIYLDNDSNRFIIITGPNMAGKSTYMRQVALTSYMAQIGSFVPATSATISLVDRIFTRVGASDDLSQGQSTFMVEMSELSAILLNATKNSLIILDEIGRGTSTYDGLSIAWATVEYICDKTNIGAKTLFATHYHELTELEEKLDGVKNYSVAVKEKGDDVIFLRKIVEGGADESYGIYVAKIAGVPNSILTRSKQVLNNLENIGIAKKAIEKRKKPTDTEIQVDMFNYRLNQISKILEKTNLDELSPKEGLDVLYRLKEQIKEN